MDNNTFQPMVGQRQALTRLNAAELQASEQEFIAACTEAKDLMLANNAGAAFHAAVVVGRLRNVLSDAMMEQVFMPLANTKIGFLTDRDPARSDGVSTYNRNVVRDCLIEAIGMGLLPTGNQFNIIAGRCYPTKEGYTALLKGIGCKYIIETATPKLAEYTADVQCTIKYEYKGDKKSWVFNCNVKCTKGSSLDQLKGKAERKAKKALYEYLTGVDLGDADEQSSEPADLPEATLEDRKAALRERKINITSPTLL